MHREAALPHRDDLRWIAAVVVPVEDDLVDTRAREARQDRPLSGADDVVGRKAFALGLTVAEPQPDDEGGGHENDVRAECGGAEVAWCRGRVVERGGERRERGW